MHRPLLRSVSAACVWRLVMPCRRQWPNCETGCKPLDYPEDLVYKLHESGLCGRFPEAALDLLSRVVGDQAQWPPSELGACLEAIQAAAPNLEADQRFDRLKTYLRRHGQE
jgi:hypothetical protein